MKPRNARIALFVLTMVVVASTGGGASVAAASGSVSKGESFAVSSSIGKGATLAGPVTWTASPSGAKAAKIEFSIDGQVRWKDSSAPYQFNGDPNGVLNTSTLSNGAHTLAVKAYAADERTALASASVTVANGSPQTVSPFTVSSSIANGATLKSSLVWAATPSGSSVSKVEFLIDGALKWTESSAPYQFNGDPNGVLNTSTLSNAAHTLAVKAYAVDGRTALTSASVTVANGSSQAVSPFTVSSSIANGATLTSSVVWAATPSGSSVSKVEFLIDGALKWTESFAPYQFNGDNAVLNTSTLSNGAHTLAVKAYAVDGRTALTSISVTVANSSVLPATTAPTLPGSVPAPSGQAQVGQTLTAATGTWVGTQPIAYGYQWLRCDQSGANCTVITDSTASHTLISADTGATLRVVVTASNGFGASSATSAATAIVQASSTTTTTTTSWTGFVGHDAYRTSDFAQISASGVKRVRMDNPSASAINAAAAYGINVLPIAGYEPWPDLNGGKGDKYPPLPQYYQTWSNRMIAQWSSLSNPPVAIEVWNEPWLPDFWQPMPDPSAYYNLVKVFATEAWKVWPNVKILVSADAAGSTNTTGTIEWRTNVLAADTTGFLNDPRIQPTTHNYVQGRTPTTVTSKPCYWDLDRFKCAYNDFKAHGHPNPQVWVTEYGWESDVVGEQNQANYTTQALSIFKNSGMVAAAYSFLYKTGDPWSYNWLRPDNSAKPVVSAVKTLITGASGG
jgi:hypothetical protein